MKAPFYLVPSTIIERLERFLDRFEAVPCHGQIPTAATPPVAAYFVTDIGCAGFCCAHCEKIQLAEDFGQFVPRCMQNGCPYRRTGCVLKQCGIVDHAYELEPGDKDPENDKPNTVVRLGTLANALLQNPKRSR